MSLTFVTFTFNAYGKQRLDSTFVDLPAPITDSASLNAAVEAVRAEGERINDSSIPGFSSTASRAERIVFFHEAQS